MPNITETPTLNAIADQYYAQGDATRKSPNYFEEYERIFQGVRDQPLRILELGVSSGASLLIWRDYLPRATIVGVDIAEMPASLAGQERIHVLRGSQDDPAVLNRAAVIADGMFDLIIDDASHLGYLTKRSFCYLFPRWLSPGGWYAIEDFGTGFLPEYPDGQAYAEPARTDANPGTRVFTSHQYGMVGVVKQLIDHMGQELAIGTRSSFDIISMALRSNIAFIQKADRSGEGGWGAGGWGDAVAIPVLSRASEEFPQVVAELRRQGERIAALEAALRDLGARIAGPEAALREQEKHIREQQERTRAQGERIAALETVLGRVLQPLQRVRSMRHWLRSRIGG